MPGSSRLPVSLRDSFAVAQQASGRQRILSLSINTYVLRNLVFALFLLRWSRVFLLNLRGYGLLGSLRRIYAAVRRAAYGVFFRLPVVRGRIRAQVDEAIGQLERKLVPAGPDVQRFTRLPPEAWSDERVQRELETLAGMEHTRWEDGRVSGAVYHGGKDLARIQTEAYEMFAVANPIHPDVFPGVRKMEAEIVAMVLSMFNAPEGAAGVTTSGGTESILSAVLSAREKARAERGITEPEMILPETAHTAFRKGGTYFGIKIHYVPCPAPTYKAQTSRISRLINRNTILLVGSAPNFPHGIIDDIAALSRLAVRHKLPLHVDCCLGSFLMPFLSRAGFPSETVDFRLPGVTSISVDTHKYGFAPKGNSCLLYRTRALRAHQYFVCPDWPGGVYASPGLAGSRPGALIAATWASLVRTGEEGYVSATHRIVGAAKRLEDALRRHPGLAPHLRVLGRPLVSCVAFGGAPAGAGAAAGAADGGVNVYAVADAMAARGWHLNALQDPPAVHVAVTVPVSGAVEELIGDLVASGKEGAKEEKIREMRGQAVNGKKKDGDNAVLYGVAGSLPHKGVVVELARGFLDTLYKA
ncbi:sphingosine-1-phosphate lyase 1 [Lineolata rhizophorae]|uniref:sphinganine-1-phosphate aldolase n=1 Tax=Lineolata rhizophorae TaxID=578093 RepID=A0A6A6P895_9PEZI|nr:sphingosine-1-phosphate lyase 1 [Lineolata rhizophorae]